MISTSSKMVKVAGGGQLEIAAVTGQTTYIIQNEIFSDEFKLLPLKGYDIILGWLDLTPVLLG
jgi:hypothetical protein